MALMAEPGASVLAQFGVPVGGTANSGAVHAVPDGAVYDSSNVWLRQGKLRARPGFSLFDGTTFNGPVLGATMVVTESQKLLLAVTRTAVYERGEFDTVWHTATTATMALSDDAS